MADTRILIVVNDAEAGKAYSDALSQLGVAYDMVPSFDQMSRLAVENAYSGLVIDILTLVRCSKEEKVIAYDCINLYPVLRVKWETKQKRIKLSPLEQTFSPDAESALKSFIDNRCRTFPARQLRRYKRKPINLNVLLSPDGTFAAENTSKAFTVNVSPGGFFLHTMQSFEVGRTLWLRFIDLSDQSPIAAKVCWSVEWGQARCIAGLGMSFERLSEDQEKEIQRLY
ncbi:MAG: pilus assembly protein PilZ [Geobacteraceae bacterium GWC2_58_44]|nr:MAG: pilus assembly protein PilZ [Geobacteraceae bacterium GWC2_58_44]HBG05111.1 PilZ domain-containing protein [Geobacter sp.]